MSTNPVHAYATAAAIETAQNAGLTIRRNDWRDIFLAITDTTAADGEHSAALIAARYVGPMRDGERWSVVVGQASFDVVYAPDRAVVARVLPTRRAQVPIQAVPASLLPPA